MSKKIFVAILSILAAAALCAQSARALYYYGGNGVGFATAAGGKGVTMTSATEQTLVKGAAATPINTLTITQQGGGITIANGLLVKIPASLDMAWDTTVTAATIGGSAGGKVSSTVSYPDPKSLLIAVTADFADGDYITVSGLSFTSFNSVGYNFLDLYTDGGTTIASTDDWRKIISLPASLATFTGGVASGFASRDQDFGDIGLRYYNGTSVIPISCEPFGTLTSALRIGLNSSAYGVLLVDPSDAKASGLKINTSGGIKSLRKF